MSSDHLGKPIRPQYFNAYGSDLELTHRKRIQADGERPGTATQRLPADRRRDRSVIV